MACKTLALLSAPTENLCPCPEPCLGPHHTGLGTWSKAAAYLLIGGPVGAQPNYSLGKLDKEILEEALGGKGTK